MPGRQTRLGPNGGLEQKPQESGIAELKEMLEILVVKVDKISADMKHVRTEIQAIGKENSLLKEEVKYLTSRLEKMEDVYRKRNIIISGIPTNEESVLDEKGIHKILTQKLKMNPADVDRIKIDCIYWLKDKKTKTPKDALISLCSF